MKSKIFSPILIFIIFINTLISCTNEQSFDDFFLHETLRIDYMLTGDFSTESFKLIETKRLNQWAGAMKLDEGKAGNMGNYRFSIFDSVSNRLLYQKGFCSLFQEWQATSGAKDSTASFYHVNLIPFPRNPIRYTLEKRSFKEGTFSEIKSLFINPNAQGSKHDIRNKLDTLCIQEYGKPENKIDLVFMAEGYTEEEMPKFKADVIRIWDYMASIPPYRYNKDKFNVTAINSLSKESGTDIPHEGSYKATCLNTHFYTFNIERYLTSSDLKSMHDIAETVPYDHLIILVNTERYGGGGFYNHYSIFTTDNELSEKVAIHEFGHSFAGLADEYYTSDVASEDFYNFKTEPWEKNITTLVDFSSKWKDLLSSSIPIPTPRDSIFIDSIGVFEGGGYSAENIYSPFQDCRMKSNIPEGFCPVCSKATQDVIDSYVK